MQETKKTRKLKQPLVWRRLLHPGSSTKVDPATTPVSLDRLQESGFKTRTAFLKGGAVVIAVLLLLPRPANGQFGFGLGEILAGLAKIQSLLSSYIAAPLKTINQAEQNINKYEQEVMYPVAAINQARNSIQQFENQFRQIRSMSRINVSSATLPQAQSLESILLSRNVGNVGALSGTYQSVYGQVMAENAAPPDVRNMTDMTDAQAQDAMKRAIEIDALADSELSVADEMGKQIGAAAPGSAPILEAEADVWLVRANAYTQAAMAELMRTRGIDLSNQSKLTKLATHDNQTNGKLLQGALTHK